MPVKLCLHPPPGYIPKTYGYGLVDFDRQDSRQDDIASQEACVRDYCERESVGLEFTRMFIEPFSEESYEKPLPFRPAGRELVAALKPGDHLIVDDFERIYHRLGTLADFIRWLMERGITLHVVKYWEGPMVFERGGMGQVLYAALSRILELRSWSVSQAQTRARARRRSRGEYTGDKPPFFCEVVGGRNGKMAGGTLVFKRWALKVMAAVVKAKDAGLSDQEVFDAGLRSGCFPKSEIDGPVSSHSQRIARTKVGVLYWFKKAWDAAGNPDINTLKVLDFIEKYKMEVENGKADVQ